MWNKYNLFKIETKLISVRMKSELFKKLTAVLTLILTMFILIFVDMYKGITRGLNFTLYGTNGWTQS